MNSQAKFIIAAFVGTIILVGILAFLVTKKQSLQTSLPTNPVTGVDANPANYELGNIPYSGGIVTKEYEIKNSSGQDLKLRKITTSCMCTTASINIDGKESVPYGMEMDGVANPIISLIIKSGGTAKVTAKFDPAAHGPAGVGPVQRSIYLFFDSGIKELTFAGNVTK